MMSWRLRLVSGVPITIVGAAGWCLAALAQSVAFATVQHGAV
jgi:hypothetical protein